MWPIPSKREAAAAAVEVAFGPVDCEIYKAMVTIVYPCGR
jgi:hypothetical protein